MIDNCPCILTFKDEVFVNATVKSLTTDLLNIVEQWWEDQAIDLGDGPAPIDREWSWDAPEIDYDGHILKSEAVCVVAGDSVEGAMLISAEGVPSRLLPQSTALFVERVFTAPRNRTKLRKDRQKYFGGVGLELLRWATRFSKSLGHDGRLLLDASPDYVGWYGKYGFLKLDIEPLDWEGVQYTPMELPHENVPFLLNRGLS